MRDKKNKIRFIVNINGMEHSFVAGDEYYKKHMNYQPATALEMLKERDGIKYIDLKDDVEKFFDYIKESFDEEYTKIMKKIAGVEPNKKLSDSVLRVALQDPTKRTQILTAGCKLYKDYAEQMVEEGITLMDLIHDKSGSKTCQYATDCIIVMGEKCSEVLLQSLYEDVKDTASNLHVSVSMMIASSEMIALGSDDHRVANHIRQTMFCSADRCIQGNCDTWKSDEREEFENVWRPEILGDLEEKLYNEDVDIFQLDDLKVIDDEKREFLLKGAERAFSDEGAEFKSEKNPTAMSKEMRCKNLFHTPVGAVDSLEWRIEEFESKKNALHLDNNPSTDKSDNHRIDDPRIKEF